MRVAHSAKYSVPKTEASVHKKKKCSTSVGFHEVAQRQRVLVENEIKTFYIFTLNKH